MPNFFTTREKCVKWDNNLLEALSRETGLTTEGIKENVRVLATVLGVELPRWTKEDVAEVK